MKNKDKRLKTDQQEHDNFCQQQLAKHRENLIRFGIKIPKWLEDTTHER